MDILDYLIYEECFGPLFCDNCGSEILNEEQRMAINPDEEYIITCGECFTENTYYS